MNYKIISYIEKLSYEPADFGVAISPITLEDEVWDMVLLKADLVEKALKESGEGFRHIFAANDKGFLTRVRMKGRDVSDSILELVERINRISSCRVKLFDSDTCRWYTEGIGTENIRSNYGIDSVYYMDEPGVVKIGSFALCVGLFPIFSSSENTGLLIGFERNPKDIALDLAGRGHYSEALRVARMIKEPKLKSKVSDRIYEIWGIR